MPQFSVKDIVVVAIVAMALNVIASYAAVQKTSVNAAIAREHTVPYVSAWQAMLASHYHVLGSSTTLVGAVVAAAMVASNWAYRMGYVRTVTRMMPKM